MKILALDVGGTSIKAAEWINGRLSHTAEYETKAYLGGTYIVKNIYSILDEYGECDRIGISTTGQVDSEQGIITYANENMPGYTGTQIGALLTARYHVPVAVENDVNAAALAEGIYGAARTYHNYLCLTYGTGIGGALVIDKQIFKGMTGSAGEVGSMIVHGSPQSEGANARGYYEDYASTRALLHKVQRLDSSIKNGKEIFGNIENQAIRNIIDEWIWEISHGLVTLIHMMNPGYIILGGGVMNQEYIINKISAVVKERIMPSFRNVQIRKAELGNTAGIFGAVYLALQKEG